MIFRNYIICRAGKRFRHFCGKFRHLNPFRHFQIEYSEFPRQPCAFLVATRYESIGAFKSVSKTLRVPDGCRDPSSPVSTQMDAAEASPRQHEKSTLGLKSRNS